MNTSQQTGLYASARMVVTALTLSLLAACGGGGGGGGKNSHLGNEDLSRDRPDEPRKHPIGESESKGDGDPPKNPPNNPPNNPPGNPPGNPGRGGGDLSYVPTKPKANPPPASTYNGKGVKVGVLDSGYDETKSTNTFLSIKARLKEKVLLRNGYPPGSDGMHGEKVSRIIAGRDLGDGWPAGAATGVDIYQVDRGDGDVLPHQIKSFYKAFADRNVKIINNSWSVASNTGVEQWVPLRDFPAISERLDLLSEAVNDHGQLLIWAAGNNGMSNPSFLAGAPLFDELDKDKRKPLEKGWLAVTKVSNESIARGEVAFNRNACGVAANWCLAAMAPTLAESAPPLSWGDRQLYGSSFAAPVVTAAAARVSQAYPWMTNSELRQTLLSTTKDLGRPEKFGWGLLDSKKALKGPGRFDTRLTLTKNGNFHADTKGHNSHFYNNIVGDAGLDKLGKGTLSLWGNNTYRGASNLIGGTLAVYGRQGSDVNVKPSGRLLSNGGTISGDVSNMGEVRVEGAGLIIVGNYTAQSKNARLVTQLGTMVDVRFAALLNDSKLIIAKPDDRYVVKQTERVLNARLGVRGKFSAVTGAHGLLYSVTPRYALQHVDVDVARTDAVRVAQAAYPFETARLASATALETALQQADVKVQGGQSNVSDEFVAAAAKLLGERSTAGLGASFDSFSGQIHASSQAVTFQQSQAVNRALSDRLDTLSQHQTPTGLWANFIGGTGKLEKRGFAKANTNFYGGQVGLDHRFTPLSTVGAAISISDANARFSQYGGRSGSQSAGLSLYGRYGGEVGTYIAGRVGHQWVDTDIKRDTVVRGVSTRVKSDRSDRLASVYGEIGHTVPFDALRATPFVGVSYDHLRRGAIDESGSAFALKGNKKSYDQTAAMLGLRLQTQALAWAGGDSIFTGYGAYRYGNATNLDYTAAFVGAPDARGTFKGIDLQRHTGWTGLGVSTTATNRLSWNLNYNMQLGRGGITNNVFSAGLRYALQ